MVIIIIIVIIYIALYDTAHGGYFHHTMWHLPYTMGATYRMCKWVFFCKRIFGCLHTIFLSELQLIACLKKRTEEYRIKFWHFQFALYYRHPLVVPSTRSSYKFTADRTNKTEGGALLCIAQAVSGLPNVRLNVRDSVITDIINITCNININY